MKKGIIILSCVVLGISCNSQVANKEVAQTIEINKIVENTNGSKMLFGEIDLKAFAEEPFSKWYNMGYQSYAVQSSAKDQLKNIINTKGYSIEIFIGTWCPDSRRDFPHFIKILNEINFPLSQVNMYAVDRQKKSLKGEEKGKNINYVPMFILYKEGKEMGRIIESPVVSLEEDLLKIVQEKEYKPNR